METEERKHMEQALINKIKELAGPEEYAELEATAQKATKIANEDGGFLAYFTGVVPFMIVLQVPLEQMLHNAFASGIAYMLHREEKEETIPEVFTEDTNGKEEN